MSLTLLHTGNVGIGTTAPANNLQIGTPLVGGAGYALMTNSTTYGASIQVNNAGALGLVIDNAANGTSNSALLIRNNNTASTLLNVGWNGNVGIGTTSPSAKLNIVGDSSATSAQLRISPTAGGSSSTSIPPYLDFWSSFDNYVAHQGPRRTATIKAMYSGGNWGYEALSFHVGTGGQNDAANLPIERLRITGSGNVGIGTITPSAALDVNGTIKGNVPAVSAYSEVTQTTTTRNAWVTSTTVQVTVPVTGKYLVQAKSRMYCLGTNDYWWRGRVFNSTQLRTFKCPHG